ncbi:MAG: hypothetical protein NXI31_17505 [bacterium]|nr:hypothetical protein [bacterium]
MTNLRPAVVLLATLASPALAQAWTQLLPAPYPAGPARRAGSAAFDPIQARFLIHGGLQSGPTMSLDDTWAFDGAAWTQLAPATTPPPRWGHRMVLDTRRLRIVMFGGRSPTLTTTANDTWEWTGTDWIQINTPNSPNPRAFYSMAFDERRGRVVLYGTQSGSVFSGGDETWEYDGTTWLQINTPFTPPGLETPAMAYDRGRGVTVMFGGWNGSSPGTMYDNTWEYDGNDWVLRTLANSPSARFRASCTYDIARGRVILYGGFSSGMALQDTWEYDGNDWTPVLNGGPVKSTEAYFGYDPLQNRTVHFGGSGPGGTSNSTWVYDGSPTAIAAPFGTGCATSLGVPALQPTTTPALGTTYQLTLTNGTFAGIGVMSYGFSNTTSAFGPLPADLGGFGLTGCQLEIGIDASRLLVMAAGQAVNDIQIANNAGLIGVRLFTQALVLDAATSNGIGGVSNAVHAVVGN